MAPVCSTLHCNGCGRSAKLDFPSGDQFFCCGMKMVKILAPACVDCGERDARTACGGLRCLDCL